MSTKIDISKFAEWLNINPLSFHNLDLSQCVDEYQPICQFWNQYAYNNQDFISRDYLSKIMSVSESTIENYLETFIRPTFITNEEHLIPLYFNKKYPNIMDITKLQFITNYKNVIGFGQKTTNFAYNLNLEYFDNDNDGINEIAQCTVELPPNMTDKLNEIIVYYPGEFGNEDYRIPIKTIEINGEFQEAIITFNFYDLLKPEYVWTSQFGKVRAFDGCNTGLYLETVDVAHFKISDCLPHGQIMYYDTDCSSNCIEKSIPFCAKIIDTKLGIFNIIPMELDEEGCMVNTKVCIGKPTRILVNYESGIINNQIDLAVFYLTAANLNLKICNCECIHSTLEELQKDTALKNKDISYNYPFSILSNPLGTKIGHIEAFKLIESYLDS